MHGTRAKETNNFSSVSCDKPADFRAKTRFEPLRSGTSAKLVPVPGPVGEVTDHFEVFGRRRRRSRGHRGRGYRSCGGLGRRSCVRRLGRSRRRWRRRNNRRGRRRRVDRRRRRCRPITGYWRRRRRVEIACKRTTNERENNYYRKPYTTISRPSRHEHAASLNENEFPTNHV